ncbi:helicase C-terminal domain-containing protein [Paenibacillus glufosinatiresistens]|uniref:helicase C-terminal domain-containing protein n=1 Tax=Paenibacillus glufosinatiresistens TaxID=3070657 RepID=UPI00286E216C|nr:helicase C-terminal domain-containing protein [Paenibacillus sp. YX.27]
MNNRVALSVRALVEHVYRSGGLGFGFHSASALAEGTRIHQAVQREYGELDRKEVFLKTEIAVGSLILAVEGRCDGLLAGEDGALTVEEIKSSSEPELPAEGKKVHWAQALLYAYMAVLERELPDIGVRLTYVDTATGERRSFERTETRAALEAFAAETAERYAPYAELLLRHEAAMRESARQLAFPFSAYRPGQRHLSGAVYTAVSERVNLFAQAPTGIGKTMSALFPAVKAIGEGRARAFLYLTAKTVTRFAAQEALARLAAGGLVLHAVTLTAKDKICFREEGCTGKSCPFAEGYYDRLGEGLMDLLGSETLMDRSVIEAYARKHRLCPFELSLDVSYACDAVICDYNYVFDPRIGFKRLADERRKETVLLIDEAHNLVDRGREMYSAQLTKAPFLAISRRYRAADRRLAAAAKAVNAFFVQLRKACAAADGEEAAAAGGRGSGVPGTGAAEAGGGVWKEPPAELPGLLERFAEAAEAELARAAGRPSPAGGSPGAAGAELPLLFGPVPEAGPADPGAPEGAAEAEEEAEAGDPLLEAYFAAQAMLRTLRTYDERYLTYAEVLRGDVRLKLFNLDPSHLLAQAAKGFRSRIHFSATLSPLAYYRDMLGAGENDYSLVVPSPFSPEQWSVSILPVSTRYRDREGSVERLARALAALTETPANRLVFFPSYAYLNRVYERFAELAPDVRTLVQAGGMDEAAREAFLAAFQPGSREGLLGFAVLGGVFAEGVDLPGDRLSGVMVVGVGLPQVGLERELLRRFFDEQGKNGFDYAYVYPGMTKVLQAGGRLIRGESDTGVIVLADDRFLRQPYADLLPREWRGYRVVR